MLDFSPLYLHFFTSPYFFKRWFFAWCFSFKLVIKFYKLPFAWKSVTKYIWSLLGQLMISWSHMMLECCRDFKILSSWSTKSYALFPDVIETTLRRFLFIILMATKLFDYVSIASLTLPKEPYPRVEIIRY